MTIQRLKRSLLYSWATMAVSILLLVLLYRFTPIHGIRSSLDAFPERHEAMFDTLPSLTDRPIEIDLEYLLDANYQCINKMEELLDDAASAEDPEDAKKDAQAIQSLMDDIDVFQNIKLYLLNTSSDPSVVKIVNDEEASFTALIQQLIENPQDKGLAKKAKSSMEEVFFLLEMNWIQDSDLEDPDKEEQDIENVPEKQPIV